MIKEMSFQERATLFATLSSIAYMDKKGAKREAKKLGFTTIEFYDRDGAQAYRFMNSEDLVIACRGTQPTEWNDIKADLKAIPVMAETVGRVHKGFKKEVDDLWPMVLEDLERKVNQDKKVWFTGHSLGAAMTTIMASRCQDVHHNVCEVYTYGSPRVGWGRYVRSLKVTHHRFVNNNDIVTRVPLWIMGYRHHGTVQASRTRRQWRRFLRPMARCLSVRSGCHRHRCPARPFRYRNAQYLQSHTLQPAAVTPGTPVWRMGGYGRRSYGYPTERLWRTGHDQ